MSRRAEGGHRSQFVLIGLAIITAGICSIALMVDSTPPSTRTYVVLVISVFFAVAGLIEEAKRDLYAVSRFVLPFATLFGMIAGFAVANPIAAAVAVLMGIVAIFSIVYMAKTQFAPDLLPDLLRQKFRFFAIFEENGVHFVVPQAAKKIAAKGKFDAQIIVQNCFSSERTLTFGLEPEVRNSTALEFARDAAVVIPGAAVCALHVPVVANAVGYHCILVSPRVAGEGGVRVRRHRGRNISDPLSDGITALLMELGAPRTVDGKMRIQIQVQPADGAGAPGVRTAEPRTEILWQPQPQELVAASRAA